MHKYLLILKGGEPDPQVMGHEAFMAHMADYYTLTEKLRASGQFVAGEGLDSTGSVVRNDKGQPVVTDGPLPEAAELVGGFYLIEVGSQAEAEAIARQMPNLQLGGSVEVRPVMKYD